MIKVLLEELKILKDERKLYREEIDKLKTVMKVSEDRIEKLEERIGEMERKQNEETERVIANEESEGQEDGRSEWSMRSRTYSRASGESKNGGLSEREIDRFRRWAAEREKEDRRLNVIIKGISLPEAVQKDRLGSRKWTEELIKKRIGVECKITNCRVSGSVIIAKIDSEEKKREIMENKAKLKGERIFIENDKSWEQRRIQERIKSWGRKQKEKGVHVKIGFGRVRIGDIWRPWEEIEREEVRREGEDQNFE
jgi:hypothetical protein